MKRQWKRALMAMAGSILAAGAVRANNLQITNVTVIGRDDTTAFVKFDISWENSWRYTNINHDAVWVFFKVLPEGSNAWQHVTLEGTGSNPTGYSTGTGTPIEMIVPADRVGMFVRRSAEGAGATAVQNVKAVWNFATNSLAQTDNVRLQALAVEMVFVAEGTFKVGTGGTELNRFYVGGTANDPFQITSEAAIAVGAGSNLYYRNDAGSPGDWGTPIPANFPKGYAAFYCMKYEVTEGQWVDFFNTLTAVQKSTRDITSSTGKNSDGVVYRNTVAWTTGDATSARRDRACGYLSWADGAAFADWAGLRPMTELEFEKACRGSQEPVADEHAWGAATIMADASRSISGTEDGTETVTNNTSSGGCNYGAKAHSGGDGGIGPLRAGIFATNGASRVSAGASYWGIMELSGNFWERSVTVGHPTGRGFTGLHGNGVLTSGGDADVTAWPGTDAGGAGLRGGGLADVGGHSRASNRNAAAMPFATRAYSIGPPRGVRSAP